MVSITDVLDEKIHHTDRQLCTFCILYGLKWNLSLRIPIHNFMYLLRVKELLAKTLHMV